MQDSYSDYTIHLRDDGESILFSREILESYSAYFAALFNFEDQRNCARGNSLIIDHIPGWAVKTSLKHLRRACERLKGLKSYTSQSFGPEELYSIIAVCDYFQMDSLRNEMIEELILMLDVENAFVTLKFAIWWNFSSLMNACTDFFIANLEDFYKNSRYFAVLPYQTVLEICQSDRLCCDEILVLNAAIDWLEWNQNVSDQEIHNLVNSVRYAWISPDHLNSVIQKKASIISELQPLASYFSNAVEYHRLTFEEQRKLADEPFARPRTGRLSIQKFNCLDDTLKWYHSTRNIPNGCKAILPMKAMDNWFRPESIRVVRTYQDSHQDNSGATSPLATTPSSLDSGFFYRDPLLSNDEHSSNHNNDRALVIQQRSNSTVAQPFMLPNDAVFFFMNEEFEAFDDEMPPSL